MSRAGATGGLGVPLLLGLLALVLMLSFQVARLLQERAGLAAAFAAQEPMMADGDRVRQQADVLMSGLNGLARIGNPTARTVLDGLARQGITYTPP